MDGNIYLENFKLLSLDGRESTLSNVDKMIVSFRGPFVPKVNREGIQERWEPCLSGMKFGFWQNFVPVRDRTGDLKIGTILPRQVDTLLLIVCELIECPNWIWFESFNQSFLFQILYIVSCIFKFFSVVSYLQWTYYSFGKWEEWRVWKPIGRAIVVIE